MTTVIDFLLKIAYTYIVKINSGWVEIPKVHRGGGIPRQFFTYEVFKHFHWRVRRLWKIW